jgi:hypothetical protein
MASRKQLLASIAKTAKDYRAGDAGIAMTADHVGEWIDQFPAAARDDVLEELAHVLTTSYISKAKVQEFLEKVVASGKLTGSDPKAFWRRCEFLNIQKGGASQAEFLALFDAVLESAHDLALQECKTDDTYIYLDDVIFSGTRLKNDLTAWIPGAPAICTVHVIVIAAYAGGEYYAEKSINEVAKKSRKKITLKFWRMHKLENKKSEAWASDVLWPQSIPDDPLVAAYAQTLKDAGYPPTLRDRNSVGTAKQFSSGAARSMLEHELLKAGALVRQRCTQLKEALRPLGFTGLKTFGFGGLTITFRNCPNTAPLALWAGDPWYPLFPRKTNTQSRAAR